MRRNHTALPALLLAGCFCPAWSEAQIPPERKPVPDLAAQATAEKAIKDLFKNEYSKGSSALRQHLATQLYDSALKTKDDAARFVLFREASDVAAAAGVADTAMTAIDAMAMEYQVNSLELKTKALETSAKAPNVSSGYVAIARVVLNLLDQEAVAGDNYAAAAKIARIAQGVAENSQNKAFATIMQTLPREIEDLKKEYEALAAVVMKLKAQPEDQEANLSLGQYLCFSKGDWVEGLPYLAKSSDPELRKLAAADLARPKAASERKAIADGWWDVAKRFVGQPSKLPLRNLQDRAVLWYRRAFAGLPPLDQRLADKRIVEGHQQLTALTAIRQLPPPAEIKEYTWTRGAAPVKTIRADEGFCFLTGVAGKFEGGGEVVNVEPRKDGFWYLDGRAAQGVNARAVSFQTAYRRLFHAEIKEYGWTPRTEPVKMISRHEGFCFLSLVCGKFIDGAEMLSVSIEKDGYWYLNGRAGEPVIGRALCVRVIDPGAAQVKLTPYRWTAGMRPVRMCHKNEGISFLAGVQGGLQGGAEDARIFLGKDDYWYLGGKSGQKSLALAAYSMTLVRTLPEKDQLKD